MRTVHEQLRAVRKALTAVSAEADSEAQMILAHVYDTSWGALIMRLFDEAQHEMKIEKIVAERLKGRPLAYILNGRFFFGVSFYVDERVLIPRFDTESVVEAALDRISEHGYRTAADICCGSGCIGTILLLESSLEQMTYGDASEEALAVAALNAGRLVPEKPAQFRCGDLLSILNESVDLIVCNPPYISESDYRELEMQVRNFEPREALIGGPDGLNFYRRLVSEAPAQLLPGGMLLVEIGDTQQQAVKALFEAAGFMNVEAGMDLAGRPRWICGTI